MGRKEEYRILSIDGGGLRGIVPLTILKYIEEKEDKKIIELFDLITGTSTGGIIACGLACGYSVDDLISLYYNKGSEIFPIDNNFIKKSYRYIRTVFKPMYSNKGLKKILDEYFKDYQLSNTIKPIIVTSYDIYNNEVVMFKTRNAVVSDKHNAKLKDVCLATSSAPVYFPPHALIYNDKKRILVDGGIYINNPSMSAISDILKTNEKIDINNIHLLSLGTGNHASNIGYYSKKWGIINWLQNIVTIMMQATSKVVDYECVQILNNYLRLQIEIKDKKYSKMSDAKLETLNYLIKETNNLLLDDKIKQEIKNFFKNEVL